MVQTRLEVCPYGADPLWRGVSLWCRPVWRGVSLWCRPLVEGCVLMVQTRLEVCVLMVQTRLEGCVLMVQTPCGGVCPYGADPFGGVCPYGADPCAVPVWVCHLSQAKHFCRCLPWTQHPVSLPTEGQHCVFRQPVCPPVPTRPHGCSIQRGGVDAQTHLQMMKGLPPGCGCFQTSV